MLLFSFKELDIKNFHFVIISSVIIFFVIIFMFLIHLIIVNVQKMWREYAILVRNMLQKNGKRVLYLLEVA